MLVCSIPVIAIGLYSLTDGDIYAGKGITLSGLKATWEHICCAVALGIAVGAFVLTK